MNYIGKEDRQEWEGPVHFNRRKLRNERRNKRHEKKERKKMKGTDRRGKICGKEAFHPRWARYSNRCVSAA
jgi:hypothetical protein